ncbi:hypothetical protein EUGRSUZ_B00996 [Eucalyptus grandis]|uniref:Uncharacterized protein n=2 Tax=Eucalyptus grandis TaxID=71139 RepID=A0ACC3LNV8_EUCGR|nr:hypothetical protein EUGRSUZ_B00996 [Eucalyptus grandis]
MQKQNISIGSSKETGSNKRSINNSVLLNRAKRRRCATIDASPSSPPPVARCVAGQSSGARSRCRLRCRPQHSRSSFPDRAASTAPPYASLSLSLRSAILRPESRSAALMESSRNRSRARSSSSPPPPSPTAASASPSTAPSSRRNRIIEVQPPGRIASGTTEIPFSVTLKQSGGDKRERFYETFHGANINIQYLLTADVTRGYLHKSLCATMEFILEADKAELLDQPASPEIVIFYITQDTQRHPLLPELKSGGFRVTGKMSIQCALSDPISGELIVETSAVPIRSVDIHILRIESFVFGDRIVTDTSLVQTTQFKVAIVISFQSELSKMQAKSDPRTPRLWQWKLYHLNWFAPDENQCGGNNSDFNVCTFFREVSCISDHLGGCSPLIQIVVIYNGWCNLLTILMAVAALSKGVFITGCKQNHVVHYVVSSWILEATTQTLKPVHASKGWIFTVGLSERLL